MPGTPGKRDMGRFDATIEPTLIRCWKDTWRGGPPMEHGAVDPLPGGWLLRCYRRNSISSTQGTLADASQLFMVTVKLSINRPL
jgi:hypothetical protein